MLLYMPASTSSSTIPALLSILSSMVLMGKGFTISKNLNKRNTIIALNSVNGIKKNATI